MKELTKSLLDQLQHSAEVAVANGKPTGVTGEELSALVAAARERDELAALIQQTHGCHHGWVQDALRCQAAEKDRDELKARVAELERNREYAISLQQQMDRDAYAKGREDERAACVAWLRARAETALQNMDGGVVYRRLRAEAEAIERGEHVRGK